VHPIIEIETGYFFGGSENGKWNALPRKPRVMDTTQQVYLDAVRDFLKTKGSEQPKVKIDNMIQVDLDGDGETKS
jgi:hypothetical protein